MNNKSSENHPSKAKKIRSLAEDRSPLLQSVLDLTSDAILGFDRDNSIQIINHATASLFGYTEKELIGQPTSKICHHGCLQPTTPGQRIELEGQHKNGTLIPISVSVSPVADKNQTLFIAAIQDLQNQIRQDEEIQHLESVLHLDAMEYLGVGIAVYDKDLKLVHANRLHDEMYEVPEELRKSGTPAESLVRFLASRGIYGELISDEKINEVLDALSSPQSLSRDLTLPNGRIIEVRSTSIRGGGCQISIDVTDAREALRREKSTDSVTGLMTFDAITEQIKKLFPPLAQAKKQAIGVRLQLDRLGIVNEIYGQQIGDQLLKQVAQRILGVTNEDALVGRAGGNEIVVIDETTNATDMANAVVKVLREAMQPPFFFRDRDGVRQRITLTLSGGIILFPQNGTDLDELIEKSRLTMQYAAVQGGDTFKFFDWKASRSRFTNDRISVENDLRTAFEEDQFFLDYQPQINLQSGDIHGVEALVRWQHPEQGLISPMDFIPIAEETGLIIPIGEWVLRNACLRATEWQKAGHTPFVTSVNVSAVQFRNDNIVKSIAAILDETGLDPKYLELELTESIVADDLERTENTLKDLKSLGISLAIDDFGTGYSSLAYLTRLPFDTLKIDQAFVRSEEKQNWAIIRAISQLARSLGLHIVAEGVETLEQTNRLAGLGCNIGQGFFFSRPLSKDDLASYFAEQPKRAEASISQNKKLRVGLPSFGAINQLHNLAFEFRDAHPEFDVEIHCDVSDRLIESLALGELDIILTITTGPIDIQPAQTWRDQPVWVCSKDFVVSDPDPVPLLAHPDGSPFRKRMLDSLRQTNRQSKIVYQSPSLYGLANALIAGMGVTALSLSAIHDHETITLEAIKVLDSEKINLPALEPVHYGIYMGELQPETTATGREIFAQCLADLIDSFSR